LDKEELNLSKQLVSSYKKRLEKEILKKLTSFSLERNF